MDPTVELNVWEPNSSVKDLDRLITYLDDLYIIIMSCY